MKRTLLSLITLLACQLAFAHDFEVANSDGVTIYYTKLSTTRVQVSCRGYSNNVYEDRYTGDIVIPADITYDGVPYTVYSIGDKAFAYCSGLTSVTIPNTVTSIGSQAFYDCTALTLVNIPNSVTSIGPSAFKSCTSLTSIDIPDSVRSISTFAFYGCSSLSSVTLGQSLTSIGTYVFQGCSQLEEITIPDSVTSIGEGAFQECSSLKAFYSAFASEDNRCLIIDDVLIAFAPSGITTYDIPASVTSIGMQAFAYCSNLTGVTIPESVTTLGRNAFAYCSSLISVTIPEAVIEVGQGAFGYCNALSSIYAKPTTPPTCGGSAFYNVDKDTCVLYVPAESVEDYKAADQWKDFFHIEGYDFSGIEGVAAESGSQYTIYDLSGRLRMATANRPDINTLPAGIYIINGKKVMVR